MASAGGTWVKATIGPNVGQLVFVPGMKSGSVNLKGNFSGGNSQSVDAVIQGGLAVHKDSSGKWIVTHVESGKAIPGTYTNKTAAMAVMEDLNSNYKWTGSTEESVQNMPGGTYWIKYTALKYKGLPANQVNIGHKTPKQIQQEQKGQEITAGQSKVPKIKATSTKSTEATKQANSQKAAEDEFNAKATGNHIKKVAVSENVTVYKSSNGNYTVQDTSTGQLKSFETDVVGAMAHAKGLASGAQPTGQVTATAPTSAKVNTNITAADFDAMAQPMKITSQSGKAWEKPGVDLGNGYTITKSEVGKYYVVDTATGKTVSHKFDQIDQAHAYAKSNTPYFDPPPDLPKSYTVFPDMYAAQKVIGAKGGLGEYYNAHAKANGYATSTVISALQSYQDGGYGSINNHLWQGKSAGTETKAKIKAMDAAFKKTATPYDMVAVRSKGSGSALYKLAQGLEKGDTYVMKGFDSSSLHYNNNWGGGDVRLVYRVPKGAPALIINGVHGKFGAYSGENELLLARNTKWNVVGKQVSGGKIEIHLDYAGWNE